MGISRVWATHDPTPLGTPCREWQGPRDRKGYGMRNDYSSGHRRQVPVHRWVMEQVVGPLPEGQFALHRCDNPPCSRFDHLRVGSNRDNVADRVTKGRSASAAGPLNPAAKLSADQVEQIEGLLAAGSLSQEAIAARFGVHQTSVSRIKMGKHWVSKS